MKNSLLTLLLVAACLVSCSKKDADPNFSINGPSSTLNYDKDHQFVVKQGSNVVQTSSLTWTSSNLDVGTVSSSGYFEAKRIGQTTIEARQGDKSVTTEITVNPYSTLCIEPFIDFTASKSTVKGKEKRQLEGETADALLYVGENSKVRNVYYGFQGGKLLGAVVAFTGSEAVMEEAVTFFSERYGYQGEEDDTFFFLNSSAVVAISYDSELGFIATYIKNTTGKTSNIKIQTMKSMFEKQNFIDEIKLWPK